MDTTLLVSVSSQGSHLRCPHKSGFKFVYVLFSLCRMENFCNGVETGMTKRACSVEGVNDGVQRGAGAPGWTDSTA